MARTVANREDWTSGDILDCCDDCESCFLVTVLPCIAFSENRRMLHGGDLQTRVDPCFVYCIIAYLTSGLGCCLYAYSTRTDIRTKYNLKEDPCNDCCVHLLCHCCAMCQEYRELKNRPLTLWPLPVAETREINSAALNAVTGQAFHQPIYNPQMYQSGFVQLSGPPIPPPQPLGHEPAVYNAPVGGMLQSQMYPPGPQVTTVPSDVRSSPGTPVQGQPLYYNRLGYK